MSHSDHSKSRADRGIGGERHAGVMYRIVRKSAKIETARQSIMSGLAEMVEEYGSSDSYGMDCYSGFDAYMV
jgi:hypothetical protein